MMQPPHFFFGITRAKRVRLNRFRIVIGVFLASIFCLSAYKLITGLLSANREQAAFAELSAIVHENRAAAEVQTSQPSLPSQKPAAGSIEVELVPSEPALHAPESDSEPVSLPPYLHLYERNPDLLFQPSTAFIIFGSVLHQKRYCVVLIIFSVWFIFLVQYLLLLTYYPPETPDPAQDIRSISVPSLPTRTSYLTSIPGSSYIFEYVE